MPNYNFYCKVDITDPNYTDAWFTTGSDHLFADGEWHQMYPGVDRDISIEYDKWDHKYRRNVKAEVYVLNRKQAEYTILKQIRSHSA